MDLTAIVVTRNEQANIARCLEACIHSLNLARRSGQIQTAEILVVDSWSNDKTVEIAEKYPVSIIRLSKVSPLSASAGRYVGLKHASGNRILYVDGDFELSGPWLVEALKSLDQNPKLAAVSGRIEERYENPTILAKRVREHTGRHRAVPEAIPIGLYRRDALDATGGFHPFLRGGEDRELAYRLRNAGYDLKGLDVWMGLHRRVPAGFKLDYVGYLRSVFWWSFGDGQAFRMRRRDHRPIGLQTRLRYLNVEHVRNYSLLLSVAAIGLTNLACALENAFWIQAVALDVAAVTTAVALSRRSKLPWREAVFVLQGIPYSTTRHVAFLLGALERPRDASNYPRTEEVMREAGIPIVFASEEERV